jgi:hypothetical protein
MAGPRNWHGIPQNSEKRNMMGFRGILRYSTYGTPNFHAFLDWYMSFRLIGFYFLLLISYDTGLLNPLPVPFLAQVSPCSCPCTVRVHVRYVFMYGTSLCTVSVHVHVLAHFRVHCLVNFQVHRQDMDRPKKKEQFGWNSRD